MLIELRCKNCNGALDPKTLKCPYCGSQYERENKNGVIHYIESVPPNVVTLGAKVCFERYMLHSMGEERASEVTMRQMTHALAEALAPYIELETHIDPLNMTQVVRGRIRVLEPDYRF